MSAQVAADLRAAAEVLRRDGWTQKDFHRVVDGRICHCAEGAIAFVTGSHRDIGFDSRNRADWQVTSYTSSSDRRDAAENAALHIAIGAAPGVSTLAGWNDAEGRTADEVIAVLEAAADAAEVQS